MNCVNCGSQNVLQKLVDEPFPTNLDWPHGENLLQAKVPVRHCGGCGEEWEDADTFQARLGEVLRYSLRRMSQLRAALVLCRTSDEVLARAWDSFDSAAKAATRLITINSIVEAALRPPNAPDQG